MLGSENGKASASTRNRKVMRAARSHAANMNATDGPLFESFCEAAATQMRAPYVRRHGAANVAPGLEALFSLFKDRAPGDISVEMETKGDGTGVLRTSMRDQPFIVDSVRLLLNRAGLAYEGGFHAVLRVQRDDNGVAVVLGGDDGELESVAQFEIAGLDGSSTESLVLLLKGNLRLARSMVRDHRSMTSTVDRVASRLARIASRQPDQRTALLEANDFLRWLLSDNFVFMGLNGPETLMGFESEEVADVWQARPHNPQDMAWCTENTVVQVRKGTIESPVHRAGRVDEIRVLVPHEDGAPSHVLLLRGMFTFRAVTQPSRSVPMLRGVLAEVLSEDISHPGSWRYKGVANVFDSLPTEYLFTADKSQVVDMIDRVLDAETEQATRVFLIQRADDEVTFVLAAMPRRQYDDQLRERMERRLKDQTGATYSDHGVLVGRFQTVLVHYYLTGARALDEAEAEALHDDLIHMATPWDARLYRALATGESGKAESLYARYATAFGGEYVGRDDIQRACRDIGFLERLGSDRNVLADVFGDTNVTVRLYQYGNVHLSETLPILTNFGLEVIEQYSDPVRPRDGTPLTIDSFVLEGAFGLEPAEVVARAELLSEALEAVFSGHCIDSPLNSLVLTAQLSWKQVDLIRAYKGYARQINLGARTEFVREVLLAHPMVARALIELFEARFDPAVGNRAKAMAATKERVLDGLRAISSSDQDTVLRGLYTLIQGTIRTNFYRADRKTWYISFKMDHDLISVIPEPKLKYEIYVHHPEVEGLHFRGGKVARGGLRWSDRVDYRTEVQGLVTTQMVKNVLIVPEGAKGGFLMRNHIEDRAARRQKADELYKWFIRGLLDLTDNVVDGKVINPPDVVIHDEANDPYLVVAADKGTAHLSDTANRVAVEEYNHWLGDAFASGGSNGYDHKKVGITARGAWQCVNRHFAEMGLDPVNTEFTCVGIGDTGGDVFGNGVIEYPKMQLRAAFNHLHIFLDPNPNTEAAYGERCRLFKAARGWDDYDASTLGPGGGIFDRKAKSIPLSPEVRKMLGILQEELPADSVVRLILRMESDLFWSGGIGTYVKASWESHADAGDPSNNAFRINADELRAKAVGEGANLSFTPAARIEYGLRGGRINTDFVDNSGGVDMSDHEVNLKILLGGLVADGEMTLPERNVLIEQLTKSVARSVLHNNDVHGRQISIDAVRSSRDAYKFGRAITWIREQGSPERNMLALPGPTTLQRRTENRSGLARSELAVLSSHVKMHIYTALKGAKQEWIPGFDDLVLNYFPKKVSETWPDRVKGHLLAHDIGMTVALNDVVADAGVTFFPTMLDLTNRHPGEVTGAWLLARHAFGIDTLQNALGKSEVPLEGQYRAWIYVADALGGVCASWLADGDPRPSQEMLDATSNILGRIGRYRDRDEKARIQGHIAGLEARGVSRSLAAKCVNTTDLTLAELIARLQAERGEGDRDAIVRTLAIGKATRILPAIRVLETRSSTGRWDPIALGILRQRYLTLLADAVRRTPVGAELRLRSDRLAHKLLWSGPLREVARIMDAVMAEPPDVSAFLVAEERLRGAISNIGE
jgi:glutamate dehydrogenase